MRASRLLLCALCLPAVAAAAPLTVDGVFLRDARGGAIVLRGVNVAGNSKVPPFRPAADPAIWPPLAAQGLNVVRLLFTWEAYEPEAGAYDETYLDYYASAARAAHEQGLWVIVDFHQDAYSRFAVEGCGEGFPAWALPPSIAPATPDNGPACAGWGTQMLGDPDLPGIWSAFYSDENGARTRFLAMVTRVATRLAGEEAVIGYDLLNEPGGDEAAVGQLYADEAAAIRAVHPGAVLFVSPGAVTSAGTQTKLARPGFDNFVYSPHYYDPVLSLTKTYNGNDEQPAFDRMSGKAAEWGVPLFLGEFGGPPDAEEIAAYLDVLYGHLDRLAAGGTQWCYTPGWTDAAKDGWNTEDFSIVDGTGALRANFRPRAFVRRVAGTPLEIAVDDATAEGELRVSWTHDPNAGETELFVPAGAFGGAQEIEAHGVRCAREQTRTLVSCTSTEAGEKQVIVRARKRSCGLTGCEGLLLALVIARLRPSTSGRQRRSVRSG